MRVKVISLSVLTALSLQAVNVNLDTVTVEESIDTIKVKNVSGEELKSGDLGESLSKIVPSVTISRRSGIANDIILRGQKRDNINVTIDGGKIYGGCPNRMDPPISHVVTNNIDSVTIDEGPYDVENFGTLSGLVKVETKEPLKRFSGELNLNVGSFGYQKGSLSMQGGNDKVKALVVISKEKSEQYKDGNGDRFQEQLIKAGAPASNLYQTKYKDLDAFTKKSFLGKLYFNIADNQKLKLSYTANRSDDVLYPNSPMDALKDDSDLYNIQYSITNLGKYSKNLEFLYYYSKVEHPMSTKYRNASSGMMGEMVNDMLSKIYGFKIKNSFNLNSTKYTFGVDTSKRTWDGNYYKKSTIYAGDSINNAVTKNKALFLDTKTAYANNTLRFGLRYDKTDITSDNPLNEPSFNSLSGYIFNTHRVDNSTEIFAGVGISHRVPDGRELYFWKKGKFVGTPTLNQTKNSELDLGVKKTYQNSTLKLKVFYSKLSDYIYFHLKPTNTNLFENIDAKIYGAELSGAYIATDTLNFEYGISYQKGKKDTPLAGQSDTKLADIVPIRANLTTNYEYDATTSLSLTVIAQGRWSDADVENGEHILPGFATANLKVKKELTPKLNLTFGVDNIFDKSYASSNTYNDLTLIVTGAKKKVLLNDPGRYIYLNASYKF